MTDGIQQRFATVSELEVGLSGVLARLAAEPGRWVLLVDVVKAEGRYIQFLAHEDGSLRAEVSSNASLRGTHRLTEAEMTALVDSSWRLPDEADRPNFWRDCDPSGVPDTASAVIVMLRQVFRVDDADKLLVRLFESTLEDPPARAPV
jgi:hypothetical protein